MIRLRARLRRDKRVKGKAGKTPNAQRRQSREQALVQRPQCRMLRDHRFRQQASRKFVEMIGCVSRNRRDSLRLLDYSV